ncbi:unnamed protein product [Rodentolepis nana]|uniref:RING-type domain-containing protein n=1 Tax=Rodentolepis nana TaxID=102285 RepID=A0A0R3T8K1_RODNA|nr:unnamed protein product [Rodentolepis nana]
MDPHILPCSHSFCLTPCIAVNDRATEVTCPICGLKCSVKNLIPDTDRCASANAYLLRESLSLQSPVYSTPENRQDDNNSSFPRWRKLADTFSQLPRSSSRSSTSSLPLPISQPQECQLCHSMVFGLQYCSALKLSICAECRGRKFNELALAHLGKIQEIKRFDQSLVRLEESLRRKESSSSPTIERELDAAISHLFKKLEESRIRSEREVQSHDAETDTLLRELHTQLSAISPRIQQLPLLIEELERNGEGMDKWLEVKNQLQKMSETMGQLKEGIKLCGKEKYVLNPDGQYQDLPSRRTSNIGDLFS